ncbi:hypothetical protein GW932_04835 [archaeon]|nr:hypothetical protein [archaeon]
MKRIVLLPKKFNERIDNLVGLQEEVNGILFYQPQNEFCPIESIFLTGIGNSGHVSSSSDRIKIANIFLKNNNSYNFVKFHTHSLGTIKKFGEFYSYNFSKEDIESYKEQLKYDTNFIGMVATPKIKLLYGLDNLSIRIVNGFPYKADLKINNELNNIAKAEGFNLEKLIGSI